MAKAGILKNLQSRTGTKDNSAVSLTVKDIPIGEIQIKDNIRKEYTDLDVLQASIREYGLLQPITVYEEGDGYVVKTGHRRFMAYEKLYKEDPDKFNKIRCIKTDAGNIAVIQLVENIQRVDLSQIDLFNALTALKNEGMTMKQIAAVLGKSEGHIKNLFMGINEIAKDDELKNLVSHRAVTLKEIAETKGIMDRPKRLDLLKKRGKREITQSEMIMRGRATKKGAKPPFAVRDCPTTPSEASTDGTIESKSADIDTPVIQPAPDGAENSSTQDVLDRHSSAVYDRRETQDPNRIQVSVERQLGQASIFVSLIKDDNDQVLSILEEDLRAYFSRQEKYELIK